MTLPLRHGVFLAPFHSLHENPTLAIEHEAARKGAVVPDVEAVTSQTFS